MKKLLFIALVTAFFAGCYSNSPGTVKEKTFAQQYAELEKEPLQPTTPSEDIALQTAADRTAEVSAAAQKERRAHPPLVESDYIFEFMPQKNVFSYDEYNQVWTNEPREKDYKAAKRLWNKPKRHRGDAPAASASAPAASADEEASYEDDFAYGGFE